MSALLAKARNNRESGFTLIELLTVIVIIGILAAIAIPVFTSQRQRAQDAASVSEARSVMTALESNAAGSAGGVVTVTATGTAPNQVVSFSGLASGATPASALTDEGATFKTGDSLTTTVSFGATSYTVVTTNTAGKATKAGFTGTNPATFSQSGSYTGPTTAVNLTLG